MEIATLKIFIATLYPSFIQCPFSNHDATLENAQDDRALLLISDLCFRDDSHPRIHSGLSYTIIHNPSFFYSYPPHNNLIWRPSD